MFDQLLRMDVCEVISFSFHLFDSVLESSNSTIDLYSTVQGQLDKIGQLFVDKSHDSRLETKQVKKRVPTSGVASTSFAGKKQMNLAKIGESGHRISASQGSGSTVVPAGSFQMFTSEDGKKIFFCDLCSYKSNVKGNINKHYMLKHSRNCPRFKCTICEVFTVKERNKLKPHYMKNHNLPEGLATSAMRDSAQV